MLSRSRIVVAFQLTTITVLGIWAAVYGGLIGKTTGIWLSLGMVGLAFFLTGISRQTEQPKSMSQILSDLEDPSRSK